MSFVTHSFLQFKYIFIGLLSGAREIIFDWATVVKSTSDTQSRWKV